jgi:DNA mismatch repair protein MutL
VNRIAILPDAVADQIAAGEVVERPASVVKELVENALDAGANRIEITLEGGGQRLISVSDDGCGMSRDDAILCVDRHATSKVRVAQDLVGIGTYGFRGEALPAIASVSRLEIETAETDNGRGIRLVLEGGRAECVEQSARRQGTTVTVRRLFFNAPARRKFLRSQAAETRAAVQAVTTLALTRIDVSFHLTSGGRTILATDVCVDPVDRLAALFGRELVDTLIPVQEDLGSISVRGFVQRPAEARPAGRRALLFVNNRPFKDPFLVRAAEAGYRATIHPGSRPTVFLWLDLPGEGVDVNVHPTKLEVRFRERRMVEHSVEEAIRASLGALGSSAPMRSHQPWYGAGSVERFEGALSDGSSVLLFPETQRAGETAVQVHPHSHSVLQVFNTYLVLETPEGLAIVDQHSAHERIIYEKTMRALEGSGVVGQRLLLPITVDLEPAELAAIEEHGDIFEATGFVIDPFGGRSVLIHSVPNPHPRFDAQRCFEEMVADLARDRFGGLPNRLERFAATYGCRAAIKAGQPMAHEEIALLLRDLFACELPPHDVHGRPTIVQLPRGELERRFGRS